MSEGIDFTIENWTIIKPLLIDLFAGLFLFSMWVFFTAWDDD